MTMPRPRIALTLGDVAGIGPEVVARSLLSWFPIDQGSPIYQILFKVTEPLMDPLRKVLPNMGMIDLSPMAVIIMLIVFQQVVISLTATA